MQRDLCSDPVVDVPVSACGLAPGEARAWLRLQHALAWSPQAVAEELRGGLPPDETLERLAQRDAISTSIDPLEESTLERWIERLDRLGVRVIPLTDPAYPRSLATLVDPPLVLLVRGQPGALTAPCRLAIVGARAATEGARGTAQRLARELAGRGVVVVSGLARGIDAAAHRGALEARGRTIGVLACGPERIYPPEHRDLAREMEAEGAIVSEMPVDTPPRALHFPLRNRIISGLCLGVIVVEARRRSGSLITVRHALHQGREVFVVPGSIEGPFAEGTNQLLRDGARAIRSARDVIEDLGLDDPLGPGSDSPARGSNRSAETGSLEARILAALEREPATRDQLLTRVEPDAGRMASALLELELGGRIVEERDGRIHRRWS